MLMRDQNHSMQSYHYSSLPADLIKRRWTIKELLYKSNSPPEKKAGTRNELCPRMFVQTKLTPQRAKNVAWLSGSALDHCCRKWRKLCYMEWSKFRASVLLFSRIIIPGLPKKRLFNLSFWTSIFLLWMATSSQKAEREKPLTSIITEHTLKWLRSKK